MRCGRSGCACTTCETCGYDYPCMCPKRERLSELKQRVEAFELAGEDAQARGLLTEAMDLLEDLCYA